MRLLFVCLGNICRSPTGEAVMRAYAERGGLDGVEIDSAGTAAWHVGKAPDSRSIAAAAERGYSMTSRARQVQASDFDDFDLLLAADGQNLADLKAIAPDHERAQMAVLLRSFDPVSAHTGDLEVPDPYYGGADGFDHVLDVIEAACAGLVTHVRQNGGTSNTGR